MANTSLADLSQELRLRANGIANNLDALSSMGLQQTDVETGQAHIEALERLDSEQEALKAQLKAKTAELNEAKKAARKWRSRVTKQIKLALEDDQERWVEFGITAGK